jgi:hypothetical protein
MAPLAGFRRSNAKAAIPEKMQDAGKVPEQMDTQVFPPRAVLNVGS